MKSTSTIEAPSHPGARRRIEHEVEGAASGALAGAVVGVSAGPPGAIAGAILGGMAGALAGAVMDQDAEAAAQRMRELDDEIDAGDDAPRTPNAVGASGVAVPAAGVAFSVRHLVAGNITGRFRAWRGSLLFDEQVLDNSRVEVEIDAASIDTNQPERDAELRSADFFDVATYPTLVFKSTKIERAGDGFKVTGDLTMHGVTQPVTLDVEYADRAEHLPIRERAGFLARGKLNRKDWGLTGYNALGEGEIALDDDIEINLRIEATKAS